MAREKFEDRKLTGVINVACKYDNAPTRYWSTTKEEVVRHIVSIVNEYSSEGYILTLRQLHYQLVTQNWIVNHDTAYKKLGNILDDCRYSGTIDWNAMEDRGRIPYIPYSVKDVEDALQDTVDQYRLDRQIGQTNKIELWTEKDALSGILRRTTEKYHIRLVVNKGYTSSSALYNTYQRAVSTIEDGHKFTILYFGDHDPSGLDMVRDIRERLTFFLCRGDSLNRSAIVRDWWERKNFNLYDAAEFSSNNNLLKLIEEDDDKLIEEFDAVQVAMYLEYNKLFNVIHIGLTMEQIKKYKLPSNPTKLTDSRSDKYIQKYGKICWEVDALKPQVLTSIVESHIKKQIDIGMYNEMVEKEEGEIDEIKVILDDYKNNKDA